MEREEFHTLLRFFKALSDESRLKILGILANRECSVGELAALLGLKEPTVSHHLARLKELGLVRMRQDGNTHVYWLDGEALRSINREILTPEKIVTLVDNVEGQAWERKVLQNFLEGERLKEIPASLKKRIVVLKWLATRFEPGVRYPEAAVNEIIQRHHPDYATLRREMVENRLMQRENGIYWRVMEAAGE
jgi:predicted transcriptional regulator